MITYFEKNLIKKVYISKKADDMMERKQKVITTFLVLVLVVVVFYFSTKAITQYTGYVISGDNVSDSFVGCLSEMDVRMYGAFWCGHCQSQEGMFADGNVNAGKQILIDNGIYYECDPRGEDSKYQECMDAGIRGYPTWIIKGELYPGEMSLERIAELSGCSLE